jgi:hypothetical protein
LRWSLRIADIAAKQVPGRGRVPPSRRRSEARESQAEWRRTGAAAQRLARQAITQTSATLQNCSGDSMQKEGSGADKTEVVLDGIEELNRRMK